MFAEPSDFSSLLKKIRAQPPAIRKWLQQGMTEKRDPPRENCADNGFNRDQGQLIQHEKKHEESCIFEDDKELIAIGIVPLGLIGAIFHFAVSSGRALMMNMRRFHHGNPLSGQPDAP